PGRGNGNPRFCHRWRRRRRRPRRTVCRSRRRWWRRWSLVVEALILHKAHGLRLAVLGHDKIARREPFDRFAVFVFDADGLDDEFGAAPEGGLLGSDWRNKNRR